MLIKKAQRKANDITPPEVFRLRRQIIKSALSISALATLPTGVHAGKAYKTVPMGRYSAELPVTDYDDAANYTNYYEFTTNKKDSTVLAQRLNIHPWQVRIEGEVDKPGLYDFEDLLAQVNLEERIYRFRCVEAWSMVVPWIGFPLNQLIKRMQPTSRAKFVEFTTIYQPENMPGQRTKSLDWPYTEGLRMDEAMHPLTLMATGMYDEKLPKQNGAPLRLVVPWKYGFKSIKAIVKIKFLASMPHTAWNKRAPNEYGFYANVNPKVSHPRWSQARERVLGASIFTPKRNTEMFNGYGEHVASLYSDMNLNKYF